MSNFLIISLYRLPGEECCSRRNMKEAAFVFLETAPFVFMPSRVMLTWICGLFCPSESYGFLKQACLRPGWNSSDHHP